MVRTEILLHPSFFRNFYDIISLYTSFVKCFLKKSGIFFWDFFFPFVFFVFFIKILPFEQIKEWKIVKNPIFTIVFFRCIIDLHLEEPSDFQRSINLMMRNTRRKDEGYFKGIWAVSLQDDSSFLIFILSSVGNGDSLSFDSLFTLSKRTEKAL